MSALNPALPYLEPEILLPYHGDRLLCETRRIGVPRERNSVRDPCSPRAITPVHDRRKSDVRVRLKALKSASRPAGCSRCDVRRAPDTALPLREAVVYGVFLRFHSLSPTMPVCTARPSRRTETGVPVFSRPPSPVFTPIDALPFREAHRPVRHDSSLFPEFPCNTRRDFGGRRLSS